MASGPTLPPQDYTREILTAAFNWLQSQPDSVRKMATTPDALVGLYMRAQRFGNSNLEADAPVSAQAFMSDLKNLAEGLKAFEEPQRERRAPSAGFVAPPTSAAAGFAAQLAQMAAAHPPQNHTSHQPTHHPAQHSAQHLPSPPPVLTNPHQPANSLNERSWAMIQEVKSHLNLSSDVDTINLMVSLAYKSLKNLLG